jgi:neural Wiskott-Aldrich syndrome protein
MSVIISDEDREAIRRMVPKASNKIQAVAVARLYVAYPNPSKWRYTGLQGVVVLSNDLVGNTYWLKLVDISVCSIISEIEKTNVRTIY